MWPRDRAGASFEKTKPINDHRKPTKNRDKLLDEIRRSIPGVLCSLVVSYATAPSELYTRIPTLIVHAGSHIRVAGTVAYAKTGGFYTFNIGNVGIVPTKDWLFFQPSIDFPIRAEEEFWIGNKCQSILCHLFPELVHAGTSCEAFSACGTRP